MTDSAQDGPTDSTSSVSAIPRLDANSTGVSPAPNINRPDERQVEEPRPSEANRTATGETVRAPEITQASSPISSAGASAALQLHEASPHSPSSQSTPASPSQTSIAQKNDTLALSDSQAQPADSSNASHEQQTQSTANRQRNRSPRDAPGLEGGSSASSQASPVEKRGHGKVVGPARELLGDGGEGAGDEMELSVPSHQEHLTADGQRYTTYEIVIRFGGRQWSVRKRYSQFDQFRHSLRKQHKEVGSFRFPNKSKFNTFSEHTKERRRTGFDEFLRLVAGLHPRPQEVDVFLAMDEHGAGVHGRVAGRPLAWTSGSVSPVSTPVAGAPLPPGWLEDLRPGDGDRLGHAGGARSSGRGSAPRVPRFPPLADQGRREKAAEATAAAAAAAAAAAMARAQSNNAPPGIVSQVDEALRRILGPDLLSVLCVITVSAVSIVAVWKVGGKPGLATLVIAVSVGLFIQNWDRGVDVLTMGLEMVGLAAPEGPQALPPARGPRSAEPIGRPRAGPAAFVRSPRSQGERQ